MAVSQYLRLFVIATIMTGPALARAQAVDAATPPTDAGVPNPTASDAAPAPLSFEPPQALSDTNIAEPAGTPPRSVPIVVTVRLSVDVNGAVQKVELLTPPQPIFDDAVIAATKQFRFEPGRYGGKPVPVQVTFTHTFLPPPPPPPPVTADQGPPRTSVLRGKLIELGTRAKVTGATVTAEIADRHYSAEADLQGKFRLELPPGRAKITINAPAHNVFVQSETLVDKQELAVSYLIERDRYDPYEIVVVSDQRREEVSRITLRGPEIQQVPGTFGDPFRVIQTLPGVSSVASLLPFPVVRGASPSSTGFLIDGIEVPMLFHLLAGPSVIHPEFIDEINFYPGGAPASYGGYTAGIVDGRTARPDPQQHLVDVDANLLQVGGLIREPIPGTDVTATIAGRYGYPGFLLGLATNQASLSYWDYQARLDGGTAKNGWTIFAFGARDELDTVAPNSDPNAANPTLAPSLILGFHRLDLRYHRTLGKLEIIARAVGGYDATLSNGTDFSELSIQPSIRLHWQQDKSLSFAGGIDGAYRDISQGATANSAANPFAAITADLHEFHSGSAFVEAIWRPTPDWLIRPGIRADVNADDTTTKTDIDPRLTVRYRLAHRDLPDVAPDSDDSSIWIKGSAGIYHQPPRFVLPLPGLDMMPLKYGLERSFQTSLGLEVPLANRFQISTEGYFNYMDPTVFDLDVNELSVVNGANPSLIPTTTVIPVSVEQQFINRLTTPETGRAYGLEVMLRRQAKSGLFGWVSYTLSRSERYDNGAWVPYDFDRTQLLNLVVGMPLRRNWDIGMRVQYESGLPVTTTAGYNTARADGYIRFDVRVDKRAVWHKWLLDFYIDVTNVALEPEEITPGNVIRYVLPSAGVRARF